MYQIVYTVSATKDLKRLANQAVKPIIRRIETLQASPRVMGTTKLRGYRDLYRIRQGDYRIIYKIEEAKLIILIVQIGHRRDIYKQY